MKKVKVTRKSSSQTDFVLRPARLRMTFIYAVLFAFALGFGLLVRFVTDGFQFNTDRLFNDWPVNLAIVIGGSILLAMLDYRRWTVRVLGGSQVEGSSGAFGERVAILIKDIDWKRTGQSLKSRIKIGNGIYSNSRQRILLSPWFYDPAQLKEFLNLIGYEKTLYKK